ncbi:AAA domain-containing protein, partial [Haematococcus lacustris]
MMEAGVPSTLLGVQYRAHPLLFEFPSARFYCGAVQSGVKPDDRPQLTAPFPPGKGAAGHPPLVFIHDGGSKEEPGVSLIKSMLQEPSKGGKIGFLRDPRRLNVAITRAKRLLVVVGNKATLPAGGCPHREAWMEYLEDKG